MEYATVEGPMGTEGSETFVVLWKAEDRQIEVLGASPAALSAKNVLSREVRRLGSGFKLRDALNRGWTYYKKEFGDLDSDTERYLRDKYPASSQEGFDPNATAVSARATNIRSRALRRR